MSVDRASAKKSEESKDADDVHNDRQAVHSENNAILTDKKAACDPTK
jgi:hypothetical protein